MTPPASVDGSTGGATAVAVGKTLACAIRADDGGAVCWGAPAGGALPPASVDGTQGSASAIAVSRSNACAIQAGSGIVVCWGESGYYLAVPPPPEVNGAIGTAVAITATAGPIDSVTDARGTEFCAIRAETGGVVCWGAFSTPASDPSLNPPTSVAEPDGAAIAVAVADASYAKGRACAIEAENRGVACWPAGSLYTGTPPPSVDGTGGGAVALSLREYTSCAIQAGTGVVVCWGDFADPPPPEVDGTLGTATAISVGGPPIGTYAIQTGSRVVIGWPGAPDPPASVDGTLGTAKALAAGSVFACAIQVETSAVICWKPDHIFFGFAPPPDAVNGTNGGAIAIAANGDLACAISDTTRGVVCWSESNLYGELNPPPEVDGTLGTAVAIGVGGHHGCAIQSGSGAVYCWGSDVSGQSSPPPFGSGAAQRVSALAAGLDRTWAILAPEPDGFALGLASIAMLHAIASRRVTTGR